MSRSWEGIVIHHSASPGRIWSTIGQRKISVGDIKRWHIEQNFGDIGYHFVIDCEGLIFSGRSLEEIGAHCSANKRNYTSIGICVIGNFQYDAPSEVQLSSLIILVKYLKVKYQINDDMIELHGKVSGAKTLCPGAFFPKNYFYNSI